MGWELQINELVVCLVLPYSVHKTWKLAWGTLWSKIDSQIDKDVDTTLISAWQDSVVVRFASTIHTGKEWVVRERKKPKTSSTNPIMTRAPFEAFPSTNRTLIALGRSRASTEYVHRRLLPIPGIVDDYNHYMNGVDIADQL